MKNDSNNATESQFNYQEEEKHLDVHVVPTQEEEPAKEVNYLDRYLKERDNQFNSEDFAKYEKKMKARDAKKRNKPYMKARFQIHGFNSVTLGITAEKLC